MAASLEAVALSDSSSTEGNRALAGASAPAAPFPRLEEDKCNRKHSRKGRYSAEMNILGYINEHGENNVAELVVTVADCRSSKEFQKKWHSFLTGFVKKRFPSGMWTRERQPRSGNWHAHCVVNLGRDIKTGFPIAEVESGNYRNVQLWIRALWKELREAAERYGVGRISLLPIKKTGPAAAKYFVKYVAKSHGSVLEDVGTIRRLLGDDLVVSVARAFTPCWLPEHCYQVWDWELESYMWDELGFRAYCEDLSRYPHIPTEYRRRRLSWFLFHEEVGKSWCMAPKRARAYARRVLERFGMGHQRLLEFGETG